MKGLLERILKVKAEKTEEVVKPTLDPSLSKHVSVCGKTLVERSNFRKKTVTQIKRSLSITDEAWEKHYLYAIHRLAELAQEHPASRMHHHSNNGGLLDHTLEVTLKSVRLSSGYILPPNAQPEEIHHNDGRWRFGIFITALSHDIGKIIGDQETVYKNKSGKFIKWQPWHGPIPFGSDYVFRYRNNEEHVHGLHEILGITIFPKLLTPTASEWLTSDKKLLGQIMHTLSASSIGTGVIGEIVRKADQASTADNLSPQTGVKSGTNEKPLHVRILEGLQSVVSESKVKKNMPGAMLWVTENVTFIVARNAMEQSRDLMLSQGQKGIPQSPVRLVQILNEHNHTFYNDTEGDVVQAVIEDTKRNWKQKLSFMVIPNQTLWVSGVPNTFSGTITVVDGKGNPIDLEGVTSLMPSKENEASSDLIEQGVSERPPIESVEVLAKGVSQGPPINLEMNFVSEAIEEPPAPKGYEDYLEDVVPPFLDDTTVLEQQPKQNILEEKNKNKVGEVSSSGKKEVKFKGLSSVKKPIKKQSAKQASISLKNKDDFFKWLFNGIKFKRIRINESGASVHIVDGFVALVSPKIFDMYFEDSKAIAAGLGKDRDARLKKLQGNIKRLSIHEKNASGQDFQKIHVRGPRSEDSFSAMLINRKHIPELDDFSENPMLQLLEKR